MYVCNRMYLFHEFRAHAGLPVVSQPRDEVEDVLEVFRVVGHAADRVQNVARNDLPVKEKDEIRY